MLAGHGWRVLPLLCEPPVVNLIKAGVAQRFPSFLLCILAASSRTPLSSSPYSGAGPALMPRVAGDCPVGSEVGKIWQSDPLQAELLACVFPFAWRYVFLSAEIWLLVDGIWDFIVMHSCTDFFCRRGELPRIYITPGAARTSEVSLDPKDAPTTDWPECGSAEDSCLSRNGSSNPTCFLLCHHHSAGRNSVD